MKVNPKLRLQILIQNSFFVVLFIALIFLLGFLANQYKFSKDITQANRNTLTTGSINVLKQMQGPITLTVFASEDDVNNGDTFRQGIINFMARYQRTKPDINVKFISPIKEPKLAQENGIKEDGEVVVEYQKRSEHIKPPFAEQEMTNLFMRLSRTSQRAVMYLDGHGERNLIGLKNNDVGEFGKQLESKGLKFANLNLTIESEVPLNGSMLVIASPQKTISPIEAKKIKKFLESGGNLLWLLDDNNFRGLDEIAAYLGLSVSSGQVIDPAEKVEGVNENIASASSYGEHAITRNFMLGTRFSNAHEVNAKGTLDNGWEVSKLIEVSPNGWLESSQVMTNQKPTFDKSKDKTGPINIAVALQRVYGKKGQRVVVVGNGNFLSNTFITNGGNLDLGINMINWLSGDDNLISIQPMPLKDVNVTIPDNQMSFIIAWTVFHSFEYFIPIGFFVLGILLWFKRRKA
ncbi:GldG family protein [Candidatus Methylopumilus planktonicus]|uniref:GldG family protein n=1 Tax=Candidatus Methylopumilus planktonicus TaxID=1581557 RepID=UPI003D18ADC2